MVEVYRLSKPFKCKCGREISVFLTNHGIVECFDCLLKEHEAKEPEDREGLEYFMNKAVVPVKFRDKTRNSLHGRKRYRIKDKETKPESKTT